MFHTLSNDHINIQNGRIIRTLMIIIVTPSLVWNILSHFTTSHMYVCLSINHLYLHCGGVNSSALTVSTEQTWHLGKFLYPLVTNIFIQSVFIQSLALTSPQSALAVNITKCWRKCSARNVPPLPPPRPQRRARRTRRGNRRNLQSPTTWRQCWTGLLRIRSPVWRPPR